MAEDPVAPRAQTTRHVAPINAAAGRENQLQPWLAESEDLQFSGVDEHEHAEVFYHLDLDGHVANDIDVAPITGVRNIVKPGLDLIDGLKLALRERRPLVPGSFSEAGSHPA